jgi:hypothetical protein
MEWEEGGELAENWPKVRFLWRCQLSHPSPCSQVLKVVYFPGQPSTDEPKSCPPAGKLTLIIPLLTPNLLRVSEIYYSGCLLLIYFYTRASIITKIVQLFDFNI